MSRTAQPSEHNRHDRLLIARFATQDSYDGELAQASALVAACSECAVLAADVRFLSAAVANLPTPRRPRDFRLSAERAQALRGSVIDRLMLRLAGFGGPALRPVAGVALSIGLVLAVVGTGLPLPAAAPFAGAPLPVNAPTENENGGGRSTEQGPGAPTADVQSAEGSPATTGDTAFGPGSGPEGPPADAGDDLETSQPVAQPGDPLRVALVYGGLTLAMVAFGLLLVVSVARRREDPLLR